MTDDNYGKMRTKWNGKLEYKKNAGKGHNRNRKLRMREREIMKIIKTIDKTIHEEIKQYKWWE